MKSFFWLALGVTLLVWASAHEQRTAIECMDGGHVWRQPLWFELTGKCTAGRAPRLLLLPPMQINPPAEAPAPSLGPEL
jgi:hypothetical protein